MTSVGIMASAVVPPSAGIDVLAEPFNNFTDAPWTLTTLSGSPSIVAGRTGTAAQLANGVSRLDYPIPDPSESDTLTIGFAYKVTSVTTRVIAGLWSDSNVTEHNRFELLNTGALRFTRTSTGFAGSAPGTIVANTWYYLEVQAKLHDTTGSVVVRVNGTEVINLTGLDTRNAGTKTVYDTIRLIGASTVTTQVDDLYLTMGAGAPFKGDITIP